LGCEQISISALSNSAILKGQYPEAYYYKKLDPVFLKGSTKAQKFSNSLPNRALFDKKNVIYESAFDVM
jgi:hypothetical protein